MKIIVASKNPVKINAVRQAFTQMFPDEQLDIREVAAPSGVADQPMTHEEGMTGARNRVEHIYTVHPDADFWVGLEGANEDVGDHMQSCASVVIKSKTYQSEEKSATFRVPKEVAALVREGLELGHAHDKVFNKVNSKQAHGMVGELTGNIIDRTEYYRHPLVLALIPFCNGALY